MSALLDVILPVFLIIGFGYAAAKRGLFGESAVDGVMRYAQNFAAPCLLFRSIAGLDLGHAYDPALMLSFYIAAFVSFGVGLTGALFLFKRPLTDAVAIGFACLFSNSLLLGLPITERAFGTAALTGNYAIISIHAPLFYGFGIAMMEWARARGQGLSLGTLGAKIGRAIGSQPLVIGIALGFAVNLAGFGLYGPISGAVDMIAGTAIPTALFGLGGVLVRYRTEGDRATIAMICGCALVLHPALTWGLGHYVFDLDQDGMRSAVVTAAMAPGVNAYMFAHLYGVAKRVNASAVLVATALSIFTVWGWLQVLP
jgi:malonate transporter and related proteins